MPSIVCFRNHSRNGRVILSERYFAQTLFALSHLQINLLAARILSVLLFLSLSLHLFSSQYLTWHSQQATNKNDLRYDGTERREYTSQKPESKFKWRCPSLHTDFELASPAVITHFHSIRRPPTGPILYLESPSNVWVTASLKCPEALNLSNTGLEQNVRAVRRLDVVEKRTRSSSW